MTERPFTVQNKAGIHCRPSGEILMTIRNEFPGHKFEIVTQEGCFEIDSILALISLELGCGESALLRVEGPDEERAARILGDLLEHHFDFPPRK